MVEDYTVTRLKKKDPPKKKLDSTVYKDAEKVNVPFTV